MNEIMRRRKNLVSLRDGSLVLLRPLISADKAQLVCAFARLSLQSRYQRFFSPLRELSPSLVAYLTEIDYVDHFAYGAFVNTHGEPALIGVARYIRSAEQPQSAEVALAVIDDFHRRGLGQQLLVALARVSLENGIARFHGNALLDNRPLLQLLRKADARISPDGFGLIRFVVNLR